MSSPSTTRRGLLSVAAATATAALAGCTNVVPGSGGGDSTETSAAPQSSDAVVRLNFDSLRNTDAGRTLLDATFSTQGGFDAYADEVTEGLGLDPRDASWVTAFTTFGDDRLLGRRRGAVVEADWNATAVRDAVGTGSESVDEQTVDGTRVFVPDGSDVRAVVLADGRYAFVTPDAVDPAIAAHDGEGHPWHGIDSTGTTLLRSTAETPAKLLRLVGYESTGQRLQTLSSKVERAAMTVAANEGDVRADARLVSPDGEGAKSVESVLAGLKELYESQSGRVAEEVAALSVDREAETVEVAHETSPETYGTVVGTFVFAVGRQRDPSPQVNFELDRDRDAGEVTITHYGGDSVDSEALAVVADEPYTYGDGQSGKLVSWRELTPADQRDGSATAGDRVTIGGGFDGVTVRLVWRPRTESMTLARWTL